MTRANALVIVLFTTAQSARRAGLSAICQQAISKRQISKRTRRRAEVGTARYQSSLADTEQRSGIGRPKQQPAASLARSAGGPGAGCRDAAQSAVLYNGSGSNAKCSA